MMIGCAQFHKKGISFAAASLVLGVYFLGMLWLFMPSTACASATVTTPVAEAEEEPQKRYWRALLESTTLLGLVSAYYWGSLAYDDDFDFDLSLDTLYKKLSGEAIRFDDNHIGLNSFPGHPFSGMYYYLIPRNHNLSRLESFLWSSLSSSIFEFLIEFQEPASISDLVVTPFAGPAIGEVAYQFGKYFRCAPNRHSLLYKGFALAADPVDFVNSFIWRDTGYKLPEDTACEDGLTYNSFDFILGASHAYSGNTHDSNVGAVLGMYGKLYLVPHYGQESDISTFVRDTVLVELGFEAIMSDRGVDSTHFFAKTIWSAYYRQNITKDQEGRSRGYSVLLGYASAFDHVQYDASEFEDWIGSVHILGPAFELRLFHTHGHLLLGVDVFGDFAMVRSFAFDAYKQKHPSREELRRIKTVLQVEDYYYAYGVTVHLRMDLHYGSYKLAAEYKYSHHDSFEGADRRDNRTNDFNLIDEREEYRLTIGRRIDFIASKFFARYPVWIEAQVQRCSRAGFIADGPLTHEGSNTWFMLRFRVSP